MLRYISRLSVAVVFARYDIACFRAIEKKTEAILVAHHLLWFMYGSLEAVERRMMTIKSTKHISKYTLWS